MIDFPFVAPKLKELDDEEFHAYQSEAKQARAADEPDRLRCIQNISAYTGLNYGQWPSDIIQILMQENRKPETYNLIAYYIEGLAGNYIANWFDPSFVASREEDIDAVGELQRAYYILKDIYNYKSSALSCIINGLCYRGIEEIFIDRTRDPRGHICFISRRPDMVVFDPSCYEDDISAHSKKAWVYSYMGLNDMRRLYRAKEDAIMVAAEKEIKKRGERYERSTTQSFKTLSNKFGDKKLITQFYHIETERRVIEIDLITLKTLPETDDIQFKIDWAKRNGIDLSSSMSMGKFATMEVDVPVLWTTTWCDEYKIILENRKDERQLNGRLPLYAWSYISKHGKSIGLVDVLRDAQENFNKLQVAKRQVLTQGHQGKLVIHEDAFMGDGKAQERFVENLSDISKPGILPAGAPPPGQVFHELRGAEPSQVLYQSESTSLNLLQLLSRFPPALQGLSEKHGESGVHYGRKVIEGNILQRVPTEKLMQHELDKAEGWVTLAPKVYGGAHNLNRDFIAKNAGIKAMLNVDIGYDPATGGRIVEKDISRVERINVVITASKENDFLRQAKREMDAIILQAMVPDETNIGVRAVYEDDLVLNSDFTDLEQKERAERAVAQRAKLIDLRMQAAIMQAQAAVMASQQMLQPQGQPQAVPQGVPPTMETQPEMEPKPVIDAENVREQPRPSTIERPPVRPVQTLTGLS